MMGSLLGQYIDNDKIIVSWNKNKESNIKNYIVEYGTESKKYTNIEKVSNNYIRLTDLEFGKTYYIIVKAESSDGLVSDPSSEISVYVTNRYIEVKTSLDKGMTHKTIGRVPYPKEKGQSYKTNIVTPK